jgi:hypothetical protein
MSLFQHPHLTRGIVHTPMGAFKVNRGIVELPDDLGASLGWQPVDEDDGRPVRPDTRAVSERVQAPALREQ